MAGQPLTIQQFSSGGKTWWSAVDANGMPQHGPWSSQQQANSWLQSYQANNNQNVTTSGLKAEARGQDVYSSDIDQKYSNQISGFASQYTPPAPAPTNPGPSSRTSTGGVSSTAGVDGFAVPGSGSAPTTSTATGGYNAPTTGGNQSVSQNIPSYDDPIVTAYRDILGRNPGREGYDFWNGALSNGMSINEIRSQMAASDEAMGNVAAPTTGLMNIVNPNTPQPNTGVTDALASVRNDLQMGQVNVNSNLQDGFAVTNENLGAVNNNLITGFEGVAQGLTDGFAGTNQNVVDTGQAILDNQAQIGNNLAQNSNQNTETILGGQSALNDALSAASADIMTSQQGLADQLTQASNNLTQYYGDIMGGQQQITGGIEGFASDFGSFRNDYDTDVIAATNARTQTQEMVQGGFDTVRNDIATQASAQQQGQDALMQAVGSANMGITNNQGFAGTPQNPAAPQAPADPVQGSVAQGVNAIRQNLGPLLARVTPELQRSYIGLVNSFDNQGNLIPTSTDAEGNRMIRQLDRSGNLTLRGVDAGGNVIGQQQLSVPQMFQIASQAMQGTNTGFM